MSNLIGGVLLFGGAGGVTGGAAQAVLPATLQQSTLVGTIAPGLTATVQKRGITGTIRPSLTGTIDPGLDSSIRGKIEGDLR